MVQIQRINTSVGLYAIFIKRLHEVEQKTKKEVIPYPDVFEKLCRNFSITKLECREILSLLNEEGIIKTIPLHGVRIIG